EYTATVWIPSSLQARMIRRAISPRFATRMRWNTTSGLDQEERLVELHRFLILDEHLDDGPGHLRLDLVEDLHGLDEAEHGLGRDPVADLDERLGARRGGPVERPDDRGIEGDRPVHERRSRGGLGRGGGRHRFV